MVNSGGLNRAPNLAQQAASIRRYRPSFQTEFYLHNQLNIYGELRPSARSSPYAFKLIYKLNKRPDVFITNPALERDINNELPPHLYSNGSLCLYLPGTRQFTAYNWLNDTIIPWISLWLYYYEDWMTNGYVWNGGGMHPDTSKRRRKDKLIKASL